MGFKRLWNWELMVGGGKLAGKHKDFAGKHHKVAGKSGKSAGKHKDFAGKPVMSRSLCNENIH